MAVLDVPANRSVTSPARRVGEIERPPSRPRPASAPRVLAPVACDHRRAPVPMYLVVLLALATCLAVFALGILSNVSAPAVPERTAVVRVEPGETLLDVAERMAPSADPTAVVARIRELNALPNSTVHPGQPLRVPTDH
ncbi:LysM peptidoglycan-binding domain-containing protein [Actinophytocola sp.]|uniref:LysM peptidoglycan-binding domain-containing protein n=1 Tax=Actinophytocola sp. TaxID=1872138 RepID=UPI002D7F466B|nr:LysM peptidoglycan-binding domain-containing protein [Actinophytocola sp.]HET9140135.1 LysM peptidoglycan-binding domain-containing protein [Actinophytocola sp.]